MLKGFCLVAHCCLSHAGAIMGQSDTPAHLDANVNPLGVSSAAKVKRQQV